MINRLKGNCWAFAAIATILACTSLLAGDTPIIDPIAKIDMLENVRNKISFKELNETDKQTIADQASLVLKGLYVHRYEKIAIYGPSIDPAPKIDAIVKNAKQMPTKQLHETIYKLFVSLRDRHLIYYFPAPYADYISFLPLSFDEVVPTYSRRKVLVSSVNVDYFNQYLGGCVVPQIGDEVIEYNGKTIEEAIQEKAKVCQGSNNSAAIERAITGLTFIPHSTQLLPNENDVKLKLRTKTGYVYDISPKWLCAINPNTPAREERLNKKNNDFNCSEQNLKNQFYKDNNLMSKEQPFTIYSTNDPVISWGIIQNSNGKFGYIKLTSFNTENGYQSAILQISNILRVQFSDTKGLVFDIRNNGGGAVELAEGLIQLFSPNKVETTNSRLLNTAINKTVLFDSMFALDYPEWQDALRPVIHTDAKYSNLEKIVINEAANRIGRKYFKPVAVFTNASSYSASDVFACGMQDNGAAVIWGEDATTGAGGANVMNHSDFVRGCGKTFKYMNGVCIKFPWRQIVRVGKNKGKLIEDIGCISNKRVQKTPQDILDGGVSQFNKITQDLALRQ